MKKIFYRKTIELLETNKIPLFVFFSSMFLFISFAGTRLFLTDEAVILNQFYNLVYGSLSIETGKIKLLEGVYLLFNDHIYGKFSYSLLILSLPVYYILRSIEILYGAHLFLLQLWALCGGIIVYLIAKISKLKHAELLGAISYIILIGVNIPLFKPIYFPMWGELLSIEFTNILISSFLVLLVYFLFRNLFGDKAAIFASFFIIFATPISFYAISLKHHALTLFLTMLAFFFFNEYIRKKEDKFMYFAYMLAGLCVWTRVADGAVLLLALLTIDAFVIKRGAKCIMKSIIIILLSLIPFFIFNYLILGSPFSIMEYTSSNNDKDLFMQPAKDPIILSNNPTNIKPDILSAELGYDDRNAEIKSGWLDILLDISFLKLKNTLGIFLVSPFLAIAFAFIIDRLKYKTGLNAADKFFGVYSALFIYLYKDYLLTIIIDSSDVLEYRYLLIFYIILLYFVFRVDKVKNLLEANLKKIVVTYGVMLAVVLIFFIMEFPLPFLRIYYYAALIISLSLIILMSLSLLSRQNKEASLNNYVIFIISLSLAMASLFLIFYYWVVSITYISPSQNFTILPVLQNILDWMYRMVL